MTALEQTRRLLDAAVEHGEIAEVVRLLAVGVRDPAIAALCASSLAYQRESRPPPRRRRAIAPAPRRRYLPREHGSERGYQQHYTDRTDACLPCRVAHSRHNYQRRTA